MTNFEKKIIDFLVIELEGGYELTENVEHDVGGLTRAGIAQKYNPGLDLIKMTKEDIQKYYYENYLKKLYRLQKYKLLYTYSFWTGVNIGLGNMFKHVQKTINILRNMLKMDPIDVDGVFGPISKKALEDSMEFLKHKSPWNYEMIFVRLLNSYILVNHYTTRKTSRHFFPGWANRLYKQMKELEEMEGAP